MGVALGPRQSEWIQTGRGTGQGAVVQEPLTGLPALRTLLSWGSLQGCVLLLALFLGTFEVQKILVGGGLMNARLWPQCQAMEPGNTHILAAFLSFYLELHCSGCSGLGQVITLAVP